MALKINDWIKFQKNVYYQVNPLFNKEKRFSSELLRKLHISGGAHVRLSLENDWKVAKDASAVKVRDSTEKVSTSDTATIMELIP